MNVTSVTAFPRKHAYPRLVTPTRLFTAFIISAAVAFAHCDNLDGPVVRAARQALAANDVNHVLPWVSPDHESSIRDAFARTVAVRKLNPDAERLADTWFFETVVRVHRQGEGAPFDGLKPAGSGLTPAIEAADEAVRTGSAQHLAKHISSAVEEGLRSRFQRVQELRKREPSDLKRGRDYVAAYVDFIHFAERVHQAIAPPASDHQH